jgi:hypothetical protein
MYNTCWSYYPSLSTLLCGPSVPLTLRLRTCLSMWCSVVVPPHWLNLAECGLWIVKFFSSKYFLGPQLCVCSFAYCCLIEVWEKYLSDSVILIQHNFVLSDVAVCIHDFCRCCYRAFSAVLSQLMKYLLVYGNMSAYSFLFLYFLVRELAYALFDSISRKLSYPSRSKVSAHSQSSMNMLI